MTILYIFAIRTKKYKLLLFYGTFENSEKAETPPVWELYDLENDPKDRTMLYWFIKISVGGELQNNF